MTAPLTDVRGRTFAGDPPSRRIISLVPSQTELLADLGLGDAVVGITRFCVHPTDWKRQKAIVGGTKQVNVEKIRALAPDLILANREENTAEMVAALDTIAPVFVTDVRDLAGALAMIRAVGRLTGRAEQAEALALRIEAGFIFPPFPPLRAAYLIWRDPYMTVGHDTFIHDMMHRAGLVNVFGDRARYPTVTVDELLDRRPSVVLLSSEPYPFGQRHRDELQALLPGAVVRLIDGELCSWYGSRLLLTPAYLCDLRCNLARPGLFSGPY